MSMGASIEQAKAKMKMKGGLTTRLFKENVSQADLEKALGKAIDDLTGEEIMTLVKVIDDHGDLFEQARVLREQRSAQINKVDSTPEPQKPPEPQKQSSLPEGDKPSNGEPRGISEKQLSYLLQLLDHNSLQYDLDDFVHHSGKHPQQLTSENASKLIEALKNGNRDKLEVAVYKASDQPPLGEAPPSKPDAPAPEARQPVPAPSARPEPRVPTTSKPTVIEGYTMQEIQMIRANVAQGATDDELRYFLYVARQRGLNPLLHEIYWVRRRRKTANGYVDSQAIIIGIDGARKIASASNKIDGLDVDVIRNEEGKIEYGIATLWLHGSAHPYISRAKFSEYSPSSDSGSGMWKTMPETMIKKVAEMLAYRMAFADSLGGLYIKEEMDQSGGDQ